MTGVQQRFAEAYGAITAPELAGPELVPVRLSMACVAVLPAAGAGLSVFSSSTVRAPIGASQDHATRAERLQFTVGEGPCLEALASGRPVVAAEAEMVARWPAFTDQLTATTPYRAVAAFPLDDGLAGIGSLDLYFDTEADLAALSIADARLVAHHIATRLSDEPWHPAILGVAGPDWLDAPAGRDRSLVAVAMGMLTVAARVSFTDALAVLRGRAFATDRTVDDIAFDVVTRALPATELGGATDRW